MFEYFTDLPVYRYFKSPPYSYLEILRQHMEKVFQVHGKFEKKDSTGRGKI